MVCLVTLMHVVCFHVSILQYFMAFIYRFLCTYHACLGSVASLLFWCWSKCTLIRLSPTDNTCMLRSATPCKPASMCILLTALCQTCQTQQSAFLFAALPMCNACEAFFFQTRSLSHVREDTNIVCISNQILQEPVRWIELLCHVMQ